MRSPTPSNPGGKRRLEGGVPAPRDGALPNRRCAMPLRSAPPPQIKGPLPREKQRPNIFKDDETTKTGDEPIRANPTPGGRPACNPHQRQPDMDPEKYRAASSQTQGGDPSGHKTKGRRGGHRKGNEAFLMLTETMMKNPAIFGGNISHLAGHALLVFYRAHIHASADGNAAFDMDRVWLRKLLKISTATAERAIAELVAAKLIVKQGRRKLGGPCQYRLVLPDHDTDLGPSTPPDEPVEHTDGLQKAPHTNRANVLKSERVNTLKSEGVNPLKSERTRARLSPPSVDEGLAGGKVSSEEFPPVSTKEDEAHQRATNSAGQWLDTNIPEPVEHSDPWEPPVPPPPPQEPVASNSGLQHSGEDDFGADPVGEVVKFAGPPPPPPSKPAERLPDVVRFEAEAKLTTDKAKLDALWRELIMPLIPVSGQRRFAGQIPLGSDEWRRLVNIVRRQKEERPV